MGDGDAHERDGNEIEFNFRSREKRISDAELTVLSKIQKEGKLITPELGRLSRSTHILKPIPQHEISPEETQNVGHIPLSEEENSSQIELVSLEDQPYTSEQNETPEDISSEEPEEDILEEKPVEVAAFHEEVPEEDITDVQNDIVYIPESDEISSQSSPKKSGLGEVVKFLGTSATIFLLVFIGLNFESYSVLLDDYLHPEKNIERSDQLTQALKNKPHFDRVALLPVAGIERQKPPPRLKSFIDIVPPDNRLIIEKIGKNVPIVSGVGLEELLSENWEGLETQIQLALKDGVVHYPATADAGEIGNFFLTGHSSFYFWDSGKYKDVFALLGKLEVGDTYTVYFEQKKYVYKIFEEKIVPPEDTSVLNQPTDEKIGTLMTCWPPGTVTYRKIYRAHQIEPAP